MSSQKTFHFFCQDWRQQDSHHLKELLSWGYPVILNSYELQKDPSHFEALMEIKSSNLSLLSVDVDDSSSLLQSVVDSFSSDTDGHLVWLKRYDQFFLRQLKEQIDSGLMEADDLLVFVDQAGGTSQPSGWQRMFTIDGDDYRQYQRGSCIYPIAWLLSLPKHRRQHQAQIIAEAINHSLKIKSLSVPARPDISLPRMGLFSQVYWDFRLLYLSVLKGTTRPWRSSLAMALGVFIACSPLYGLQTLLIAICCWLFRLNFAVAFFGAQISLPPTYTLVVAAELLVGSLILGKSMDANGDSWMELAQQHTLSWFVGFLLVGTVLAALSGVAWWALLKKHNGNQSQGPQTL
jgi:uncharacterized protein